jgi:regulator of protease activity HflC (stomatin/prohibitin superfamily)
MKLTGNLITTKEVYYVYGKMLIMNTARAVVSKYTVDEVNTNYARITDELYNALKPKLKGLPLDISDVTIGELKYPEIVTKAIEKAKERRMEIEQEKASVQIALTKKAGEIKIAKADYEIKMLEAKRIRDYNSMTAKGITPQLLKLRRLELEDKALDVKMVEAKQWNGVRSHTIMNSSGQIPIITNLKD